MKKRVIKKYIIGIAMFFSILLIIYIARNIEQSLARYVLTKNIDIPITSSSYYLELETGIRLFNNESLNTSIVVKNNDGTNYADGNIEYTIIATSSKFDVTISDSANGILVGGNINSNTIPVLISKKPSANLSELEVISVKINVTYPYVETKTIIFLYTEYISDGIKLHYDGINNTVEGHSNNATIWKDLVGNNDGTTVGAPIWHNDCLEFNGTNSKVQLVGEINNEYTISLVILPLHTGAYPRILGEEAASGSTGSPAFPAIYMHSANSYRLGFYGQGRDSAFTGSSIPSTTYKTTVTVTYDRANVKLYINGQYISQIAITTLPTQESNVYLGGNGGQIRYYTGKIYNCIWYDRALTPAEVQHNFEVDTARFDI